MRIVILFARAPHISHFNLGETVHFPKWMEYLALRYNGTFHQPNLSLGDDYDIPAPPPQLSQARGAAVVLPQHLRSVDGVSGRSFEDGNGHVIASSF